MAIRGKSDFAPQTRSRSLDSAALTLREGCAATHSRKVRLSPTETREARNLLSVLLEASGNSVFSCEIGSDPVEASPAFEPLIGDREDVVSRDQWLDRIHPDDRWPAFGSGRRPYCCSHDAVRSHLPR
tara:strand:- start:41 stop:424 length:384 start_codon:yes stop_codon:yes gene_type:complete